MRKTLGQVKRETAKAVKAMGATVVSIEWLGEWTKEKHGSADFRVARVVLAVKAGWTVTKLVTVDTTGYVRIG